MSERFDANLPAWLEWQRAPWGRLFYTVAQANLRRHLSDRPLRVLDVAGGNGPDAIVLARLGHEVTLVDFSAAMLDEARAQLEETHLARGIFGGHRSPLAGEDVIRLLETAGFQVEGRYGIRCLCDYLANDELKFEPATYQALEKLELLMTDRYPYYLIARFFQVLARK